MQKEVLIVTPPFSQLNTPYPASPYLKGFFNTQSISSFQADLGLELFLKVFCAEGLEKCFASIRIEQIHEPKYRELFLCRSDYIASIDPVIEFLKGASPNLAYLILQDGFLPKGERFENIDQSLEMFGVLGIQDQAKHYASLYLDELADFMKDCVDPWFGLSRYGERLGRSAYSFDELYDEIQFGSSYFLNELDELLEDKFNDVQCNLLAITVPFPGNLLGGFRIAKWFKKKHPSVKLAMGGGFVNTELRELSDPRVFEFVDFVCLDQGETPLLNLLQYIKGERPIELLKRTFVLQDPKVEYSNLSIDPDVSFSKMGTPDYSDLLLKDYISVMELANPMHRLWSDGRWNKLTMALGCYWAKCTFCDISLDYIKNYVPATASLLCDRIEQLIEQTGERGFHFVDEAAPPSVMKQLAIELLRRKIKISWWTNIRFEHSFSLDLCLLLKASGCIAVTGGLEVASDRLLKLIDKGVTVPQVAKVCEHFTESGIMVHAYLMYGYPTQTDQETIDSLEMVRQMFEIGILQSAFWHQFALTAHSPVYASPQKYRIEVKECQSTFAKNDMEYFDLEEVDHSKFSDGLRLSLQNYMTGVGFDLSLQKWFPFKIPKTNVAKQYILQQLENQVGVQFEKKRLIWIGKNFSIVRDPFSADLCTIHWSGTQAKVQQVLPYNTALFFNRVVSELKNYNSVLQMDKVKQQFEDQGLKDFASQWHSFFHQPFYHKALLYV
ncbi:MAG TPA: radical SAM protein [Saprospiraceae bacterium]|nr:radical SAM protein [Saprospiraceae bacterium]